MLATTKRVKALILEEIALDSLPDENSKGVYLYIFLFNLLVTGHCKCDYFLYEKYKSLQMQQLISVILHNIIAINTSQIYELKKVVI